MTRHLALTGGIASGKSHVSTIFAKNPLFTVIDADILAHQLTESNGKAISPIQGAFGAAFITRDGSLNRPQMRELVFNDSDAKKRLESIVHPMIRDSMKEARTRCTTPFSVSVIPLLVESGTTYHNVFQRIIVVDCPESEQLHRLTEIRGLEIAIAHQIIRSQVSRGERISIADDILYNQKSLEALSSATRLLIKWYCSFLNPS